MAVAVQQERRIDTDLDGVETVRLITDNGAWVFTKASFRSLLLDIRTLARTEGSAQNFTGGRLTFTGDRFLVQPRTSQRFSPNTSFYLTVTEAESLADII